MKHFSGRLPRARVAFFHVTGAAAWIETTWYKLWLSRNACSRYGWTRWEGRTGTLRGWVDGWMDGHGKDYKGRMGLQRRSRWALEALRVVCMTWLTFINDLTDDLDGRAVGYPMNLSLLLRLGLFLVTQVGEATEATRWPRGRDRMGLKMDLGVHRSSRRSGKEAFAYLVWIFMSSLYLCERTLNKIDKIGPFRSVCLYGLCLTVKRRTTRMHCYLGTCATG